MTERSTILAAAALVVTLGAAWACGSDDSAAPDGSASGSGSGSSSGGLSGGFERRIERGLQRRIERRVQRRLERLEQRRRRGERSGAPAGPSVLQVGHDVQHRMTYTQPAFKQSAVSTMAPVTTFNTNATFPANGNTTGQGLPSVLYLENGLPAAGCPSGVTGCTATSRAAGAGIFLAFAGLGASPNVFAFDETTGLPVWTAHVTNGGSGGGDGIRGTPAIDLTSLKSP